MSEIPYLQRVLLPDFIEKSAGNSLAVIREQPLLIGFVHEVHALYEDAINVVFGGREGAVLFLGMSHAAYLAATCLGTSGQLPSSYAVIRTCIENALVGYRVFKNQNLKTIWMNRDQSVESRATARREFRYNVMKDELDKNIPALGRQFGDIYESTITLGGHPNSAVLLQNLQDRPSSDPRKQKMWMYTNFEEIALRQTLFTIGFGGLTVLSLFLFITTDQLVKSGLHERLRFLYRLLKSVTPMTSPITGPDKPLEPESLSDRVG